MVKCPHYHVFAQLTFGGHPWRPIAFAEKGGGELGSNLENRDGSLVNNIHGCAISIEVSEFGDCFREVIYEFLMLPQRLISEQLCWLGLHGTLHSCDFYFFIFLVGSGRLLVRIVDQRFVHGGLSVGE